MENFETYEKGIDSNKADAVGNLAPLELFSERQQLPKGDSAGTMLPNLTVGDANQVENKEAESNWSQTVVALDNTERVVQGQVAKYQPSLVLKFAEYCDNFRTRATAQGISLEEQLKTFSSLNRMLQATETDSPVLSESNRALIAVEFMYHAEDPSTIDQGDWDTCGAATIEERMFAKFPSKVADMVQQVALTGQWKAPDGKEISVGDKSVLSMWTPKPHPPINGDRTMVSQLFQVTALNDLGQRGELSRYQGKIVHYMEVDGVSLVLQEGVAEPGEFKGISSAAIQNELSRLSGEAKPHVLINFDKDNGSNRGVIHFETQEQFQAQLQNLKARNDMPVILSVYGNLPPFSDPESSGHVVSVSDIRSNANGKTDVYIDNQWGKGEAGSDGWYPLEQIFNATKNTNNAPPVA